MLIGTFIKGELLGRGVRCGGNSFRIEGIGPASATEIAAHAHRGDLAWDSWRARQHCVGCAHVERWALRRLAHADCHPGQRVQGQVTVAIPYGGDPIGRI